MLDIIFCRMERYREQFDPSDPLAAVAADSRLMRGEKDNPWINTTLNIQQKTIKRSDLERTLIILTWCDFDTDVS